MSIAPISPVSIPTVSVGAAAPTTAGPATGSGDFMSSISDALSAVSDAHAKVDELSVAAATGDLTAVHQLTMATAEAQLLTQLTVEVRNRAVEAFNEIMRMQV
ncbi:MAG: flagellar hook-basal body complex protein FliE [Ilumatobacter sp.]